MSHIKKNKIITNVPIDQNCVISISGVTPGECATLGSVQVEINGFLCETHVVPEDFPIDTDGLLDWDILTRHEAKVNAAKKRLEVGRIVILVEREEQFVIPPHARQVIYARVQNTEDKIGFVPLQDLGAGLLFGNFVAENKDGKSYALCYNTGDEPVALSPPLVELEPCEIMREKDDIFDEDINNGFEANEFDRVNVLRVFPDKDSDRTARILRELDPQGEHQGCGSWIWLKLQEVLLHHK